jgi:hypothetical protein
MSLLTAAVDFLTGGGITGIATGVIGAYTKIQELKLVNEHRQFEMRYEVKMHGLQFKSDKAMMDHNLLISAQQGQDATFQAAIKAEGLISSRNLSPRVNGIRALFRPGLTLFLWVGTFAIAFFPVTSISAAIALTFQQGASAATGFWFGSRAVGNAPTR